MWSDLHELFKKIKFIDWDHQLSLQYIIRKVFYFLKTLL